MSRFVPANNLLQVLAVIPAVRRSVDAQLDVIADEVRDGTPVRTGRSRDTIRTDLSVDGGQLVGRVYSNSPLFHLLEWGSINNPAFAPMRTAVDRLKLRQATR